MTETPIIGVIGFGELGTVAATSLRRMDYHVVGYDPTPAAQTRMRDLEVTVAEDLKSISTQCDIVVVFVATADQTRQVLVGKDGLFDTMAGGTVVLHATVDPTVAREVAGSCPPGVTFIDAPVTVRRTTPPTYFAFVGATSEPAPEILNVLDSYCHDYSFVGGVGTGQAAKLVNNVMSLVNTAVATEALNLAVAFGIDRDTMHHLALKGSASSHALRTWEERGTLFESGDGDERRRKLAKKDLDAAVELARTVGATLPLTETASTRIKI